MASLDLDPIFVKALRLLHSKARDSADQLRQMVNDSLHSSGQDSKEHGSSVKLSISYSGRKGSPKHPPSSSDATSLSSSSKKSSIAVKEEHIKIKKEVEKRAFDKLKQDLTELGLESVPKKPRLDPPKISVATKTSSSLPTVTIKELPPMPPTEDNTSASDIALEMGLACVVCRSFDVSPGNRLVECQDCHTLYHQECHRPPITEQDVNDPRLVWYCAKCTKNIKKLASKNQKTATSKSTTSSSSSSSTVVKETITITKPTKVEPVATTSLPSTHIFKRVEPKMAGSSSTSVGGASAAAVNKPIGLAGLAASLSGKSHPTPKPSHSGGKPPLISSGKSSSTATGSSSGGNGASSVSKSNSSHSSTSSSSSSTTTSSSSTSKRDAFSALVASTKISSSSSGGSSSSVASGSGGNSGGFPTSSKLSSGSSSSSSSTTSILASTLTNSKSASGSGGGSGGGGGNGGGGASGASSLASTTVNKASSSLMSADKRLQIMKKKAAAKMQEKRRLSAK